MTPFGSQTDLFAGINRGVPLTVGGGGGVLSPHFENWTDYSSIPHSIMQMNMLSKSLPSQGLLSLCIEKMSTDFYFGRVNIKL